MGWYFGHERRKDLIEELLKPSKYDSLQRDLNFLREKGAQLPPEATAEDYRWETVPIAKCFKGIISGVLYSVWESTAIRKTDNAVVFSSRYIRVDLIKYYKPKAGDYGGWGYKPLSEDMGPCETSCPIKYLDMVPDPGGYATEWRKAVRERAAALKPTYRALLGEKTEIKRPMTLTNGESFSWVRVMSYHPFRVKTPEGTLVNKFPKRSLKGPYVEPAMELAPT